MYKSHLQHALGSFAIAAIDGAIKAHVWDVKACEETQGMKGILVCVKAPTGEDESETYSFGRGPDGGMIAFYDLGEFIPTFNEGRP